MSSGNKTQAQRQGQKIEQLAAQYLQRQGVTIIEKNMTCRHGEIDIIGKHGGTLLFVEVRFRGNTHYGSGAETVNWLKQQKLIKAAQYYLQSKKLSDNIGCRFDVVSVSRNTGTSPAQEYIFQWIPNAFDNACS